MAGASLAADDSGVTLLLSGVSFPYSTRYTYGTTLFAAKTADTTNATECALKLAPSGSSPSTSNQSVLAARGGGGRTTSNPAVVAHNNGLLSHARLDSEIIALEGKISSLKTNNNLLQIKISSLQNLSSNSDLVDEQIRNVLGYGKSNEYIVFFDK